MTATPILLLSDAPALPTGLARIGRDLATLCSSLPEFDVAYLGRGTATSRQLPFHQYCFEPSPTNQWGEESIERAWRDHSRGRTGVIFTIQDPSRMTWFARPTPALGDGLYSFLTSGLFQRWGYFPVDATGPGDKLTVLSKATLEGYDRALAYTKWGSEVLSRTLGRDVDWIPHGLKLDIFQPRDKTASRMALGFPQDAEVVGCVMTNQARKDWGLWGATAAGLRAKRKGIRFWVHTDTLERYWSLPALLVDYKLADVTKVTLTGQMNDTEMSYAYSACDLTILPSLGEGFGYPIVESIACGVPCLHGYYGGGAEFSTDNVSPTSYRVDGLHNCLRPVYSPEEWVFYADRMLDLGESDVRRHVAHLDWPLLWKGCWKKWLLGGLA